jgi:dCMP deaminase
VNRPEWCDYFMEFAKLAATRSTCIRRQVGAVLVKDNQILATGYNGVPKGIAHCISQEAYQDQVNEIKAHMHKADSDYYNRIFSEIESLVCLRQKNNVSSGQRHELCRGVHAEQNVIIQAAYHGVSIANSVLFCTHYPCSICMKMIINAGIERVYHLYGYPDQLTDELARAINHKVQVFHKV